MSIPWAAEHVPAILDAWYPSEEGGNAVADVLFGSYSPAGRLPVTCYQSEAQLPDFQDYRMDNRTYRYFKGTPLFPFGFGLSYTQFGYSDLKLSGNKIAAGSSLTVSAKVQNTGKVASDEVVQVYLSDLNASAKVPIRKLVGFQRISLKPGEKKSVHFEITPKLLSFVDDNGNSVLEPNEYSITLGGSQGDKRSLELGAAKVLQGRFRVEGPKMVISKVN
jgi:beta-glucosidase